MNDNIVRIARDFHWEMGHRLPFHQGGCANLHGHSYRLRVEIEGVCDENGMLLDFADLKRLVQPLLAPLDHAFVCNENDGLMRGFLTEHGFKSVYLPFNSTAENLTKHLAGLIWDELQGHARFTALKLRLHETESSYAEYSITRSA